MSLHLKTTKLKIQPESAFVQNVKKHLSEIDRGRLPKKAVTATSFTSLDALEQVLTSKRLRLLHVLKEKKPQTGAELAKYLKRDVKEVRAEIQFLKNRGVIEVKPTQSHPPKKTSSDHDDTITIAIPL